MASVVSGERGKGGKFSTQEWAGQMKNQIGQRLMPAKVGVDRKAGLGASSGQVREGFASQLYACGLLESGLLGSTLMTSVTQATSNLV